MCESAVEKNVEPLLDLGDARSETRQPAPFIMMVDSIWAFLGWWP